MPTTLPPSKQVRSGTVDIPLLMFSTTITFAQPMPNTNYKVYTSPQSLLNSSFSASNLTVNGFTLNISLSVAGKLDWVALEQ